MHLSRENEYHIDYGLLERLTKALRQRIANPTYFASSSKRKSVGGHCAITWLLR